MKSKRRRMNPFFWIYLGDFIMFTIGSVMVYFQFLFKNHKYFLNVNHSKLEQDFPNSSARKIEASVKTKFLIVSFFLLYYLKLNNLNETRKRKLTSIGRHVREIYSMWIWMVDYSRFLYLKSG